MTQGVVVFMKCGVVHSILNIDKTVFNITHEDYRYWKNAHVLAQINIIVNIFEVTRPGKKMKFLLDKYNVGV